MRIAAWIVVGLVAGLLASAIDRRATPMRALVTGPIGAVGAVVGGLIGDALDVGEGDRAVEHESLPFVIGGACVMLLAYRLGRRPL